MGEHTAPETAPETAPDMVPAAVRRWLYVAVVVATATVWTLTGLGVLTAGQSTAITGGLGILSAGLAVGYVPKANR